MGMEKRGVCGMCHNKCDIVATLEHGRLVRVELIQNPPGEGSVPGEKIAGDCVQRKEDTAPSDPVR